MPEGNVLNFNTRLVTEPLEIELLQNRAFRFGDAIFETILIRNGKPHFFADHMERLIDGMEILGFTFDEAVWVPKLKAQIDVTIAANEITHFGRLRITVFRTGKGAYLPETDEPSFLIEVVHMKGDPWTLKSFKKVGIYHHIPIVPSPLTRIKSSNSLPYVMAARFARQNGWDDALLRSSDGYLIEGSMANLFIVHAGTVFTPPVFGGCLPGIMRKQVIRVLKNHQVQIKEKHLTILDLNLADEIFLCNAIRGLVPVKEVIGSSFEPFEDQIAEIVMNWILDFTPPPKFNPQDN